MRSHSGITDYFISSWQAQNAMLACRRFKDYQNIYLHQTRQMGFAFFLRIFQDKYNRLCNGDYIQCNRNRSHLWFCLFVIVYVASSGVAKLSAARDWP